ncbi:MAG: AAA family ATPase [Prochlorococcus sp.]
MSQDLFTYQGDQARQRQAPLADRMRPRSLDEFVGQTAILGEGRLLRRAIAADRVGNLLLHGPPGVGKTTLARIIAGHTRAHFSSLNAVLAGVKDLRAEVEAARSRLERHGLRTILFIDEVHRFNSAQQDALLPWVENGTLTLIGATTENPYFEVNKALVSRSRLFRLQTLDANDLNQLLQRALADQERGYGNRKIEISEEAADHLANVANGDARSLLNALELAVESSSPDALGVIEITLSIAEESIQERAVLYDKQGDAHFDTISAFIKSLRGSDADAALFWLARMVEAGENPRFIFRRMLIAAGEDIGLADPQAIVVVEACAAAFERVGLPEGLYPLAQAAMYLACSEKSNSLLGFFEALRTVKSAQRQEVPSHLRDGHRDGAAFGDGVGYRYPHSFAEHWVAQQYLPNALQGEVFWSPGSQGWEGQRRLQMLDRRAAQLAAAAESAVEQPLLLSSGPERPDLERWLQRQLNQEGNRLHLLRERLWSGVHWQRHDRVAILSGRSLLWAIDPLRETPEGGVTILCPKATDRIRLAAQLDMLDPVLRPTLLVQNQKEVEDLPGQQQFEWLGGRLSQQDLDAPEIGVCLETITQRCVQDAGLRLLNSRSALAPAAAVLRCLEQSGSSDAELSLLLPLVEQERIWIDTQNQHNRLLDQLHQLGWQVTIETWQEPLSMKVDSELEDRWLSPGCAYRSEIADSTTSQVVDHFRSLLKRLSGEHLPLPLLHHRIAGRLNSA